MDKHEFKLYNPRWEFMGGGNYVAVADLEWYDDMTDCAVVWYAAMSDYSFVVSDLDPMSENYRHDNVIFECQAPASTDILHEIDYWQGYAQIIEAMQGLRQFYTNAHGQF